MLTSFPFTLAVIVAFPSFKAVTTPFSSTDIVFGSELSQVTFAPSVPLPITFNFLVCPILKSKSFSSIKIVSSCNFSTTTLHVAVYVFPFSVAVTVIVVSPGPTAITSPLFTVATFSFEDSHL